MICAYICRFVAYMAKGDFRYKYQGELTFGGIKVHELLLLDFS